MASLSTVKLSKPPGTSWGFRLQGGKDFATPLCIQKVNVGSVAAQAGLQAGDTIVSIAGVDALTLRHKEAQDTIVRAGNSFDVVIQRGSQIWKPNITTLPEVKTLSDGVPVATKTSLAATQKPVRYIGSNHNRVPKPFPGAFNNGISGTTSFKTFSAPKSSKDQNGQSPLRLTVTTNGCHSPSPEPSVSPSGFISRNNTSRTSSTSSLTSSSSIPHFDVDEATSELTISGTDITLDKEKARDFLLMTLDKENVDTLNLFQLQNSSKSNGTFPFKAQPAQSISPTRSHSIHAITQSPTFPGSSRSKHNGPPGHNGSFSGPTGREFRKHSFGSNCSSISSASSHDGDNDSNNQKDGLVLPAYNTPINIYSDDSIAETLSAQAEVLGKTGVMGINFKKYAREEKIRTDSPTYKLLHGDEEPERKSRPPLLSNDDDDDQQGYYNINDKLYCDAHAKQAARVNPPAPNLEPVVVPPGANAPFGAVTAQQASRMKVPAAFQQNAAPPSHAPVPAPEPEPPAPVFQEVQEPAPEPVSERAPVSAPAPPKSFAPAPAPAPALAPVAAAPRPAPNFGSSANPQGFGAPAHDANVRSHIPKKGTTVTDVFPQGSERPICNSCQAQIRGPFVSALGKTWCPDHFICATTTCKRNIIDMGFVEEKGGLYCENCYESYMAPICGKCDKRIKGDCLNAVGKQFHPECFCCAYCGRVFGSGAFYLEDGLPYCETDWNDLFTTKCVGCNFPIEAGDRWVEALNNNYHSQCFKCSKCHLNLEGQSFFAKGGKPFCKSHAQRGIL